MQPKREHGITLISLLVGTTISLLLVTGMLQLFKSVIRTSSDAGQDAKSDTQLTSALLTTGMVIHNAGFGIDGASEGTDFIWLKPAMLTGQQLSGTNMALLQELELDPTPSTQAALIWRKKNHVNDSNTRCEALYIAPISDNATELRVHLYHLESSSNCPQNLQSIQWDAVRPLGSGMEFSFQVAWEACTPMGHTTFGQTPVRHAVVQINATSSSGIKLTENYCLRNFSRSP